MEKKTNLITITGEDNTHKFITRIAIKVKVKDIKGTFNITDLMLQTGDKSAIWNSHPSEVRWSFNE